MSGSRTEKMLALYVQQSHNPLTFFEGMFLVTPYSFFETEAVELDVVRSDNSLAITVQDVSAGYRMNVESLYENSEIIPPAFKEAFTVNAFELLKRQPGKNPFENPNLRLTLIQKVYRGVDAIARKIRRSNELQAAQVLQEGKATFRDENDNVLYTLNYGAKPTHFPTTSKAWTDPTADILGDLASLAAVVRTDGLVTPNRIIFGANAWANAQKNAAFMARLDIKNANYGMIEMPQMRGNGGTYHGKITIGTDVFEMWTYDGTYKDPKTQQQTYYMHPDKVTIMSTQSRLDAAFGAVPNIGELLGDSTRSQFLPELPPRLSSLKESFDIFLNAWMDDRKENLFAGAASRPVFIPTALDSFGTLTTVV